MLNRFSTEECMTKDEFLYELEKETLSNLRHYLCNHLQPEKLLPFLQSKYCLSIEDCEQIQSQNTTRGKVNRLIDIILKSGPGCLTKLIKAIKKCNKTQLFIAEKIESKYTNLMKKDCNKAKLEQITNGQTPIYQQTPPPPYTPPSTPSVFLQPPNSEQRKPCPSTFNEPVDSRVPVEWPSARERSETTGTCVTNMLLENVSVFNSADYKQTDLEGQTTFINDQREEFSKLTLENPSRQEPCSVSDSCQAVDETVSESVMEQHRSHMRLLQRRHRLPDEHDSSLVSTEIKQLRPTDIPNSPRTGDDPNFSESIRSPRSDDFVNRYRVPDDESFEVSGEESTLEVE